MDLFTEGVGLSTILNPNVDASFNDPLPPESIMQIAFGILSPRMFLKRFSLIWEFAIFTFDDSVIINFIKRNIKTIIKFESKNLMLISELDLKDKKVLVRVDFNVPMNKNR